MLKDLLTKKEFYVLTRLAEGYKAREIAEQLDMGKRSVDEYLRRIYEKLEIPQRTEGGSQATIAVIIYRREYPDTPMWYERGIHHTPRKALPKGRTSGTPKSA